MKKFLMAIILLLILCPIKVKAISAESAIVMDQDSGRVLFSKSMNKEKLIASITKIMTCILAIENGNLDGNVKITEEVLQAYGSNIYIELGEEIKLIDLLYGLMLRSGNDAAIMIAKEISGNMEKFAALMNSKAHEIGMNNSIFYNSHGLEEKNNIGNKSTAYDMALLTRYAMKNETFRKIFGTKSYNTESSYKAYSWTNKNKLLRTYKYTTGGKTGFTDLARRTLVTTATKEDKNLIVVTLNDGNDFQNHKNLYEEYFKKYNLVKVLDKENFAVVDDKKYKGNLTIKNSYSILVLLSEEKDITTKIELKNVAFKTDNKKVGIVKVYLKDELMHEEGIYIMRKDEKVKNQGFFGKLWDFIKFWN